MKILTLCASATILSVAMLNAAHATDAAPKSRTVQFADLDLNRSEGAATLFSRINGAAQAVCRGHIRGTTLRDKQGHAACIGFAVSSAVARVDAPALSEYVANRSASGPQARAEIASNR